MASKLCANLWSLGGVEFETLHSVCTESFLEPLSLVVTVIEVHHDGSVTWSPTSFQSVDDQTMQWTRFVRLHKNIFVKNKI